MGKDEIDPDQLYQDKFTPWDVKRPDSHLAEIVKNIPVKPCRALELGCAPEQMPFGLHGRALR